MFWGCANGGGCANVGHLAYMVWGVLSVLCTDPLQTVALVFIKGSSGGVGDRNLAGTALDKITDENEKNAT